MAISERVFRAALAGLIHDVGKLEQRARPDPWNPPEGIEREGQPVHAAWTTYFVDNSLPDAYRAWARHAAYHHVPSKSPAADQSLSELVSLADKLSSGERADIAKDEEKSHLPKQMVTIFDRVSLRGIPEVEKSHYLPLRSMALNKENLFPKEDALIAADALRAYDGLCQSMQIAARYDPGDFEAYLENLLGAFEQMTWCVPSAYYHSVPDISLYDHSRMTAALAVCLSEWKPDRVHKVLGAVIRDFQKEATSQDEGLLKTPAALLVGGDISGLQDFIYTISSKKAAKMLRGRSFYLQLLTEAILRFILRGLGLPYANVIYSGGGHFFLLAPLSAKRDLIDLRRQITARLIQHHSTDLYLALGWSKVPVNGFRYGAFSEYWMGMHRSLNIAKLHRYRELDEELYSQIFEPPEYGGNPDQICSVCGCESGKVKSLKGDKEDAVDKVCDLCRSFAEQIGRELPHAEFIALGLGPADQRDRGDAFDALASFGMQVQFLRDADASVSLPGAERCVVWALEDPVENRWPETNNLAASHRLRYTVNRVPDMSFDQLQNKADSGFKRLGVLRMDMDNLGEIFSRGLEATKKEENRATLARLATLSLQTSLFFEGWVKRLAEKGDRRGLIYAVYAGGDDVFLIGPWDRMPALAMDIEKDFKEYTGGNPDLHISGGIAFIGGKYPVYQAAEDAGNALDKAKDLSGKEAFCFLDRPLKWRTFSQIAEMMEWLKKLIGDESLGGSRSILQILQRLAEDSGQAKKGNEKPVWGPWMWHGAYLLTRMAERTRKKELKQEILSLRDRLNEDNYSHIGDWGMAARWAQLELRGEQSED